MGWQGVLPGRVYQHVVARARCPVVAGSVWGRSRCPAQHDPQSATARIRGRGLRPGLGWLPAARARWVCLTGCRRACSILTACSPRRQRCMLRRDKRRSTPSREPAPAKAAGRSPRPTPVGEYDAYVDGKLAPTARARSEACASSNWPREARMIRPTVQALGNRRTRSCCAGSARMARQRSAARSARSGPLRGAGLVAGLAELLEEP
jgi:hypothetical protein